MATMAFRVSSGYKAPVGLFGLMMTMARVRGDLARMSSSQAASRWLVTDVVARRAAGEADRGVHNG